MRIKRLTILILAMAGLSMPLASSALAQTNFNCFQPSETNPETGQTPSINATRLNNIRFADRFPGADIGAKVNAAISDLGPAGGTVYVPAGNYTGSTTLLAKGTAPIWLVGAGKRATIITYTGTADAMVIGDFSSTGPNTNNGPVRITGLQLKGQAGTLSGIHLFNISNVRLDDVESDYFAQDGLRAEFAQYVTIINSNFSANSGYGINIPQAVISGYTRGNEQSNTWTVIHTFFFTNHLYGVREQATEEMNWYDDTFQGNVAGGFVATGDNLSAIGGCPVGTASGTNSVQTRLYGPHFESNTGYGLYLHQSSNDSVIDAAFDSRSPTSGHFVVASFPGNTNIRLINPKWLDNTNQQINVQAGAYDDIDLGNSTPSRVTISATNSNVYLGNLTSADIVGVGGRTLTVGPTDTNTNAQLQGASVSVKATNPGGAVKLQDSTGANDLIVSSSAVTVNAPLQIAAGLHINQGGANSDFAFTLTLSGGTATKTFSTAFASAPAVVCSNQSNQNPLKVVPTTKNVTVTSAGATDVIGCVVAGNPN